MCTTDAFNASFAFNFGHVSRLINLRSTGNLQAKCYKRAQYWNECASETWVDADYLLGILKDEHIWCDTKLEGCKILSVNKHISTDC